MLLARYLSQIMKKQAGGRNEPDPVGQYLFFLSDVLWATELAK